MKSITQVAQTMQTILTTEADRIAREEGFVQRASKMTGAKFVQTLVFGWLKNPQASLEQLTQMAASLGVEISPQGLQARFSQAAANYLQAVLAVAVKQVVAAQPVAIELLERFTEVLIQDSTKVTLPEELAQVWRGCGSNSGQGQAAVKIEVRWELRTGQMIGPYLEDGRVNEHSSLIEQEPMPVGALYIADLGYWNLKKLQAKTDTGRYWLSYLRSGTLIYDQNGRQHHLLSWLQTQSSARIEWSVYLGAEKVPARLLAVRVPQEVADRRRAKLRDVARKMQRPVNPEALILADWTIVVTNVPPELLTLREALILIRIRWQVELLFKLWKSHGYIDEWRSQHPWRILSEVYGKLLVMLIQHWFLILSCWRFPDRSLFKAAQTVQCFALSLALAFHALEHLIQILEVLQQNLLSGCRINRSKKNRRTFQLLLDPTNNGLA